MKLVVLGSGSGGNAFALICNDELLLVDAGFSGKEIERRLAHAGIDVAMLVGIALTHEHGDHACGALRLASRHDVPIIASLGTWLALTASGESCDFLPVGTGRSASVGCFTLSACPTSHDAAEPIAIGVQSSSGISIGIAYDLGRPTQAVRWFLRDRHCLILEANHDETLLRTSGYPIVVQQRIAGPGGHLSNADAARLLGELFHEQLHTVVLAHLSRRCNSDAHAHEAIHASLSAAGFVGQLVLAAQDGPMEAVMIRGPVQLSML